MQSSTRYIKFALVFLFIHFVSFYFKILALGLIYGPLIYAIAYGIPIKSFIYHLTLPVLFFCYTLLYGYGIVSWNDWFPISFSTVYYLLTSISMIGYYLTLYLGKNTRITKYSLIKKELIQLLYLLRFFYVMGCLFTIASFFASAGIIEPLGFNSHFLMNLLIGVSFLIVLYYLYERNKEMKIQNEILPEQKENIKIMQDYEKEFNTYFEKSKLFLEPDISLEMLSEKMDIPKHHLSKLFNAQMGKSFYVIISEYRIKHAKKVLKSDLNITIESLSYECGFNSKSTFNKYFKEQTGYSPSEYRLLFLNFS